MMKSANVGPEDKSKRKVIRQERQDVESERNSEEHGAGHTECAPAAWVVHESVHNSRAHRCTSNALAHACTQACKCFS